ncbi:hypothetical protein [Phascolarctobacterium sp.]|uniref:hypothetical protein n=1 Tax=Phascolarctobacterium sp. TaxID=2049039 RepID=UPI003867B317
MTEQKGTRGGARPGAGRPRIAGDTPTKQVQFRLTAEQTEVFRALSTQVKAGLIPLDEVRNLLRK